LRNPSIICFAISRPAMVSSTTKAQKRTVAVRCIECAAGYDPFQLNPDHISCPTG
jgi:hypothetical protein